VLFLGTERKVVVVVVVKARRRGKRLLLSFLDVGEKRLILEKGKSDVE